MRGPALALFHSLSKKIHQPLPLNSRQSQRLLDVFKSSFRQQLDERYGRHSSQVNEIGEPATDSALSSVSSHLERILANPILRSKRPDAEPTWSTSTKPGGYFQERCNRDHATLNDAESCLREALQSIPAPRTASKLIETSLGTQVIDWLCSQGLNCPRVLVSRKPLLRLLTPFAVAEEKDDFLLNQLYPKSQSGASSWNKWLIFQITLSKKRLGFTAKEIIESFLSQMDQFESICGSLAFGSAGRLIVNEIFSGAYLPLSLPLYDGLLQSSHRWDGVGVSTAHLQVRHPRFPDVSTGLALLAATDPRKLAKQSGIYKDSFICLCLDLGHLLLSLERVRECEEVLEYVAETFSVELGPVAHALHKAAHESRPLNTPCGQLAEASDFPVSPEMDTGEEQFLEKYLDWLSLWNKFPLRRT